MLPSCGCCYWCFVCMIPVRYVHPFSLGLCLKIAYWSRGENLVERGDVSLNEEMEAEVTHEALTKMGKDLVRVVIAKKDDKVGM